MPYLPRRRARPEPVPVRPEVKENTDMTDTAVEPEAPTDPHTAAAAALTAQAARLRTETAEAAQEAAQALTQAQAEAARIVREAQNAVNAATQAALKADREAQDIEGVAGLHRHAVTVTAQITDTETLLARLDTEHADLTEQARGLEARIAELNLGRQATQANVGQAIDDGDAERLARLRAELAGTQEITAALTGKLTAARARLAAIGDRSDVHGQTGIPTAVRRLEALRADQDRVLDALDPDRPGAELRASLARLAELSAYAAKNPAPAQAPQFQSHVQGSATGARTAVVRRNA